VLEHDLQVAAPREQRAQVPVDEHRLAVEDVDLRVGDLAVHQQRQAAFPACASSTASTA
jgi:hypothetical protein